MTLKEEEEAKKKRNGKENPSKERRLEVIDCMYRYALACNRVEESNQSTESYYMAWIGYNRELGHDHRLYHMSAFRFVSQNGFQIAEGDTQTKNYPTIRRDRLKKLYTCWNNMIETCGENHRETLVIHQVR